MVKEESDKVKLLHEKRREEKLQRLKDSGKQQQSGTNTPAKNTSGKLNNGADVMKDVTVDLAKKWREIYLGGESYRNIAKMYNLIMPNGQPYTMKVMLSIKKLDEMEQDAQQ
jgi:predicted transcriptional regulator